MRHNLYLVLALVATGCAVTYEKPTTFAETISTSMAASKAEILRASKRALVTEGFQITSSDDSAGVISTAPRNLRLTPAQADCGTTMGIDYLKDNRTTTRVAFGVIAEEGKLTTKANIEGEYKPGAVDQDITLTCVSRGTLEREMAAKIKAATRK